MPLNQPPTGVPESEEIVTIEGHVSQKTATNVMGGEQSRGMLEMQEEDLISLGRSSMGLREDEASNKLQKYVPALRDYWKQVGISHFGELYWLKDTPKDNPVKNIAKHFQRIVFILMGRKLGGLTGQKVTTEGKARVEMLTHFLKRGVLAPEAFDKATLMFSGHSGEAEAFFSQFIVNMMESELPWTRFLNNMHMETDAAFSNENISFSHDDILEKYGKNGPVLWIICSTDFHIQSLLIAHASCGDEPGSPLTPLLESKNCGDRVAFLSAQNPYRHNTDFGVRASQRIMEATFFFGQAIQNNLGSLRDRLDSPSDRLVREIEQDLKKEQRYSENAMTQRLKETESRRHKLQRSWERKERYAQRVYQTTVNLFALLPAALEYIRGKNFPERSGKIWKGTSVGPRLTEIDSALTELDFPSWKKGKKSGNRYKGTFGEIFNNLEAAVGEREGVALTRVNVILTEIREKIIEDIRHWGDPENTLKQPKK